MTKKLTKTHSALDRQHILFFAKKADSFLAEHKHILLALKRKGCRLSLVAQRPTRPLIRQNILDLHLVAFSDHGKNPFREALVCGNILRLLYRLRPQIVVAYTLKPILYSAIANELLSLFLPRQVARFRLIAVFTGLGRAFLQRTPLHKAITLLLRPLLRNAAQLWVLNEHNRSFLQTFLRPKNTSHISDILVSKDMGIDLTRFRPPSHKTAHKTRANGALSCPSGKRSQMQSERQSEEQSERQSKGQSLRFLFLGRLLKAKGVSEYLQAARLLQHDASPSPNWEFWLAGSEEHNDPDRMPLEEVEKAAARGIVTWCGERKDTENLLSSVDCLVLPSYYAEGLPRVILEAAAMRVPAIVARYPGWERAVIENKTALVCACRDARALFDTMRTFAALPPRQRQAMGEEAHTFALQKFSQEKACRFYLSSLARVAERGS